MQKDAEFIQSQSHLVRAESAEAIPDLSKLVYQLVFRRDFSAPGFALIQFDFAVTSRILRQIMVELKELFSRNCSIDFGEGLGFFTLNRFDQKATTKPHRDGAPSRSVLILGYEPSEIESKFSISDYSQCAFNLGLSPKRFLEEFNPMYEAGLEQLKPYTTMVSEFDNSRFQILVVNNSCEEYLAEDEMPLCWLGVLHSAQMIKDGTASRVINSMGLAPVSCVAQEEDAANSVGKTHDFLHSDAISGGYS